MNNRTQMQLFRRHQREPCIQIETHLGTKYRSCAGAGAVGFFRAVLHDMLEQIEINLHYFLPSVTCIGTGCNTGDVLAMNKNTKPTTIKGRLKIWPIVSQSPAK